MFAQPIRFEKQDIICEVSVRKDVSSDLASIVTKGKEVKPQDKSSAFRRFQKVV